MLYPNKKGLNRRKTISRYCPFNETKKQNPFTRVHCIPCSTEVK
jgi:hypothetical protein